MKNLNIVSQANEFTYIEGYFVFEVECEDGELYTMSISKEEVENKMSKYARMRVVIEDFEIDSDRQAILDIAQDLLEDWENSPNKDYYNIEVLPVVKKLKYIFFYITEEGFLRQWEKKENPSNLYNLMDLFKNNVAPLESIRSIHTEKI